jgi:hypothetical protein
MRVCISSGHGSKISGAVGPSPWGLHEHKEAVRVVDQVAIYLRGHGVQVVTYEDTVSTSQNENLDRIISWHNSQGRDLDVSVHFNSTDPQPSSTTPVGTECWYYTSNEEMESLAETIASEIAMASGLKDRGPKPTTGLAFLKNTSADSVLIEVCFVNAKVDCDIYRKKFELVCEGIAAAISGNVQPPDEKPEQPPEHALFYAKGTCSWFGGPEDTGVSASEGLAFFYENPDDCPHLMLPEQPPGTSGMARRLDPGIMYVACRWDYDVTPKEMLRDQKLKALVKAKGKSFLAYPADWGPHEEQTGRAADLSPALMGALGVTTDDIVEVIYPAYPAPTDAVA